MNILLVSNTEDLYGASKCLLRLARELVNLGHNVSVVVPGSGLLVAELRRSGAQVIVHPLLWTIDRQALAGAWGIARFAYTALPSIAFVAWQVLRRQIHVIHSNTAVILAPAVAASLLRKPHVWHIRESFMEFPALWSIHRRAMCWLSSIIIAISRPIGDQFPSRHSQKVRVIHDGLSSTEF
jgi:hypothetical protein